MSYDKISNPTGVHNIAKYTVKGNGSGFTQFKTGAPVHVKAAIVYNDLLKYYNQHQKYARIAEGNKIKWVYLKQNQLGLAQVAYKGYEDPPEILDFIKTYIDVKKMYAKTLHKKIETFYNALNWEMPIDKKQNIESFFDV